MTPVLDDICANRHGGNECSREANRRVQKETDRMTIMTMLSLSVEGMTLDQLSYHCNRPPNQISGRLTELAASGLIVKTGKKRKTRSGCPAAVWKAA